MSDLNDANTRAVALQGGKRIALTLTHFVVPGHTWRDFAHGGDEAYLELLKTDLVALAGQVQARINEVTVTTPEDFG